MLRVEQDDKVVFVFNKNSLQGEGRECRKETECGRGLGSWDTIAQHASRDTTSERWGERTHSKTQAQLR